MDWNNLNTPLQKAHALWSSDALELSPTTFRQYFDQIYNHVNELEILRQLGGAIHDYLRKHPKTLTIPSDLPERLLQANEVEARVIGLKLLKHSDMPESHQIEEIIRAINRKDDYESWGGLHELGSILEMLQSKGKKIDATSVMQLQRALRQYPSQTEDLKKWVGHLLFLVDTVTA